MIANGASVLEFTRQATEEGMTTLIDDALCKIEQGLTTADEVIRELGAQVVH